MCRVGVKSFYTIPRTTTLHCFLVVVMDSRNLLICAMIMEFNGILNLTPRKVRLQHLVVTPLLCPSNWATLAALGWVSNVKYLGCYFLSRSCDVDTTRCVGKFYGSFNNILNVLGKRRNDMLAVHLIKIYCLPMLLCSCEIWGARPVDMRSVDVSWNNAFRKIFNACWRER